MEDDNEKEKVYVKKRLNWKQIQNQFKDFTNEIGWTSLLVLTILALLPTYAGLLALIMFVGMEFLASREKEQIERFTKTVEVRKDGDTD